MRGSDLQYPFFMDGASRRQRFQLHLIYIALYTREDQSRNMHILWNYFSSNFLALVVLAG